MTSWNRPGRQLSRHLSGLALAACFGLSPSAAEAICGDGEFDGNGPACCPCDCNADVTVTVDEIVRAVNAALTGGVDCRGGDCFQPGPITVDYIIMCINSALNGCTTSGSELEECDDGGRCVGGANAGTICISEDECMGDGACFGGMNDLRGCATSADCAGAPCLKCRPYGGDGCAANCTAETDDVCTLVPLDTGPIVPFGSRAILLAPVLAVPPLPLIGSQVLTFGKLVDGAAPVVIKASDVHFEEIDVAGIACACARGGEASTCGGTLFDRSGAQSANCTPGFIGIETCPADKPCAAVHGPGNAGSGFIGCGAPGFNVDVVQDCNGTPGAAPLDPDVTVTANAEPLPSNMGSGLVIITAAIGTVVGPCTGTLADYGPDGEFCTNDDPVSNRGTPNSIVFTTNSASATVLNPADFEGEILGPNATSGAPLTCANGTEISISGTNLAGAFTSCDQPTIADIAVTVNFVCE